MTHAWRPPLALTPTTEALPIDVWRLPLNLTPLQLDALIPTLAPDETERAARYHFDRDRRRFTAVRGLLRAVLGRYLALTAGAVTMGYDSYGKPFLTGSHPIDLRFNVTHSGDVALLAIAERVDLGVDVEVVRELADREQLAARFFATSEAAGIAALPEPLRDRAFFTCWTRKEAYIKAIGLGLSEPLDAFEVSVAPSEAAAILRICGSTDAAKDWSLHDLSHPPDYSAALAVRTRRARVVTRDFSREIGLP